MAAMAICCLFGKSFEQLFVVPGIDIVAWINSGNRFTPMCLNSDKTEVSGSSPEWPTLKLNVRLGG